MSGATWFSESKRKHVALSDMVDGQLHNSYLKLLRGHYRMENGEAPSDDERMDLIEAFYDEFVKRGMEPPRMKPEGEPV